MDQSRSRQRPDDTREKKIKEWKQFGLFCIIALAVRSLLITPCRVPSGSMLPTLQVGDFPILWKTTYGWSRYSLLGGGYIPYFSGKIGGKALPKRGDVVVFTNPKDTSQDFIKRVVGLPGDSVQMIGGILHLNNKPMELSIKERKVMQYDGKRRVYGDIYTATLPTEGGSVSYEMLKQYPFGQGPADDTPKYFVPEKHFFVMGDNPDGSGDSRYMDQLGFVHTDYLLGRPVFTYLSIDSEDIYLTRPWTWLLLPFKIRFNRCLYQPIQPVFSPSSSSEASLALKSPETDSESSEKDGNSSESRALVSQEMPGQDSATSPAP